MSNKFSVFLKTTRQVGIVLFILAMSMNLAMARTLHLIIIYQDESGINSEKDQENIKRLAEDVAVSVGMSFSPLIMVRENTNSEQIANAVRNLNCGSDDVIWFYYSGHGANGDGTWPMFVSHDGAPIKQKDIHDRLKAKGARFVLSMYDCCNGGNAASTNLGAARLTASPSVYTKLFINARGDVMMCSSKQGSASWGDNEGGAFTRAFKTCIGRMQEETDISWGTLFENVKKMTSDIASSIPSSNGSSQIPNGLVNITGVGKSDPGANAPDDTKPTKPMKW